MAYDVTSHFQDNYLGQGMPEGVFEPIDCHFARFMVQLSDTRSPELMLAAALVSRLGREGHTCLDLNEPSSLLIKGDDDAFVLEIPSPEALMSALKSCPVVGCPGDYRPLILDEAGRLYLHRSFESERLLAQGLLRMNAGLRPFEEGLLCKAVARLFQDAEPQHTIAALIAATRSLCVITGGPGTGKTTLVLKILALLLEQEPQLKIALAAPTGKAARRIADSIHQGIGLLDCPREIKAMIPSEASTIHRLLGFKQGSTLPRQSALNPLRADVVVIDEASMADLALMSNLLQALKQGSRLILLGDKNQLASVQAGYVLGDICDTGFTHGYSSAFADLVARTTGHAVPSGGEGGMADSLVELTRTYRFSEGSPIYALSSAVNAGDVINSSRILRSPEAPELGCRALPGPEGLSGELEDIVIKGYEGFLKADDIRERLSLFDAFRILCPLREGPYGVKAINRMVEGILQRAGLLTPSGLHYSGRPILIARNDYTLNLFNGDIAIIANEGGNLRACLRDKDGSVRKISPARLPEHETAFAMTVHKSQGSEFDEVLLILPERDSPVLTRELVYTGITRARKYLEVWTDKDVFAGAVARRTQRSSGLNSLLWGKGK